MKKNNYIIVFPVLIVSFFNVCYTEYKMKKMYSIAELNLKEMYKNLK